MRMSATRVVATAIAIAATLWGVSHRAHAAEPTREDFRVKVLMPWTGDFDGMVERRVIRALVVPTRTQYWVERGQQTGFVYDLLTAFEAQINQKYKGKNKNLRVQVAFIPTSRADLERKLQAGLGDIAGAALTITPERSRDFDFGRPFAVDVREIVVTGKAAPQIASIDDLAGKEVFVRKSSSYWTHLEALSDKLSKSNFRKNSMKNF